jgi:hypothetical protein
MNLDQEDGDPPNPKNSIAEINLLNKKISCKKELV